MEAFRLCHDIMIRTICLVFAFAWFTILLVAFIVYELG